MRSSRIFIVTGTAAADTTPPVLTSPTGTKTGSTTAEGDVYTNEGNGYLYIYTSTSATAPSISDHKDGTSSAYFTNVLVTSVGTKTFSSITGLDAATNYYNHYLHVDAASNESTQVVSSVFTTDSGMIPLSVLTNANQVIGYRI